MKSTLTFRLFSLALMAATSTTFAQPVLTAATSTPAAGQNYNVHSLSQFSPSTSGANQNWDFSTLPFIAGSPSSARSYAVCSVVPNCSQFPGTTVVDRDLGNVTLTYLAGSSSALSVTGVEGGNDPQAPYSNPDDILRFPMTYNGSYVDAFSGTFNSGGTYYRTGTDSVKADGWGTLKTVAGIFPNVMRVERIQTYRDSPATGGSTGVAQYKVHTYTWYSPAYKTYLYTTSRTIITYMGNPQTTFFSGYTAGQSSTEIDDHDAQFICEVFPVPARDVLYVRVQPGVRGLVELTLTDAVGRVVRQTTAPIASVHRHQASISTAHLASGIYMLSVRADEMHMQRAIAVE